MALPEGFTNTPAYFVEVVSVLSKFKWLFIHPNTHLFTLDVLDCMPKEWSDYFHEKLSAESLHRLGLGKDIPDAPKSLNEFIKRVNSLRPHYKRIIQFQPIHMESTKGLACKKQHEISLLAPLIYTFCRDYNIDYAIDIGCGLGYLTNHLAEKGIKILGIDGNIKFIKTAREKYPAVSFEQLFVTLSSSEDIIRTLKATFPEFNESQHRVCLVALHACADLTVDMLKLCLSINCLKTGVIMPCCYHRMKQLIGSEGIDTEGRFVNFPLSNELKLIVNEPNSSGEAKDGSNCLNGTFLRLACQRADWKNQNHGQRDVMINNLMFRNLLQLVVDKERLSVQRRRRKTGSSRGDYTIDNFLTNLSTSYAITSCRANRAEPINEDTFSRIRASLKDHFDRIYAPRKRALSAFTALQNLIQPVCENLVLLDRCVYVRQGASSVSREATENFECVTIKVTDECVSPRCFALAVSKQNTPRVGGETTQ